MSELSGRQKKHLRALAHGLRPVVHVGKNALTDAVMESIAEALERHELIKVKFVELRDQKDEACDEIDQRLDSQRVGIIGHTAIFYRQARDPEYRKIALPS